MNRVTSFTCTALLLAPLAVLNVRRTLLEVPNFGKLRPSFSKPWKNTG
ncbi:MAG: hypothetical protein NTY53_26160 [Kiritimatiellaeota bacterium]|nr:hypothetical protein [Kiritimatiellota bacterium]